MARRSLPYDSGTSSGVLAFDDVLAQARRVGVARRGPRDRRVRRPRPTVASGSPRSRDFQDQGRTGSWPKRSRRSSDSSSSSVCPTPWSKRFSSCLSSRYSSVVCPFRCSPRVMRTGLFTAYRGFSGVWVPVRWPDSAPSLEFGEPLGSPDYSARSWAGAGGAGLRRGRAHLPRASPRPPPPGGRRRRSR